MFHYFLFLVALVCAQAKQDFTGHRLISVQAKNAGEVEFLRQLENSADLLLDFWTEPSLVRTTDIRVPPISFSKLRKSLKKAGIDFSVMKENIQELIDVEARSMSSRTAGDITGSYLRYPEIIDFVYYLQDVYPNRVKVTVYGETVEHRPLLQVKIAENLNIPKKAIYTEAGTHAREWITVSTTLNLIYALASGIGYGGAMLEKYDWYITPSHNPDGYEFTHSTYRMWRKNKEGHIRPHWYYGYCGGTDLNRNWGAQFGGSGSSGNDCSETYRGTHAFSANETKYLDEAVRSTPNVIAFFSLHCYSQMMLVPYGYTTVKPSDYDQLKCVADHMMEALEAVHGRSFQVGTPPDLLYVASGTANDYFFDTGIKYAYTYELRPATANEGGFVLNTSHILPAAEETIASLKAFTDMDLSKPCTLF